MLPGGAAWQHSICRQHQVLLLVYFSKEAGKCTTSLSNSQRVSLAVLIEAASWQPGDRRGRAPLPQVQRVLAAGAAQPLARHTH